MSASREKLAATLSEIGLTLGEAQVYIALLSLGPTTALKVARLTGIKRTTVYLAFERLLKLGIATHVERGLKRLLVAEPPQRLESLIERRADEFRSVLPELNSLFSLEGVEAVIKKYEGIDALRTAYDSLLASLRLHDSYCVYGDPARWDLLDKHYFKKYIEKRLRTPLSTRVILVGTDVGRRYQETQKNFQEEVRLLPQGISLDVNMTIVKDRILIHQLNEPVLYEIYTKGIVSMQQQMFDVLWGFLSPTP